MTVEADVRFELPVPGVCRVCGCTDDEACFGGCWWVDAAQTVCSACAVDPEPEEGGEP